MRAAAKKIGREKRVKPRFKISLQVRIEAQLVGVSIVLISSLKTFLKVVS